MIVEVGKIKLKVTSYGLHELDRRILQEWQDLEERAIESNAYLSPSFIVPALKYLTPSLRPLIICIEFISGFDHRLTGVGVFEYSRGTRNFPLPHVRAYLSPHSYLTGLLIDKDIVEPTLTAFFEYFRSFRGCYGIKFENRTADTQMAQKLDLIASHLKIAWIESSRKKRAILIPQKADSKLPGGPVVHKTSKSWRRHMKWLSKMGNVGWQVLIGKQIDRDCIDRFLNLEHRGWKGTEGTSLLSKPHEEAFFREMISGFAQSGRAYFTELAIGDRVISSTSNLISAKAGFAFKVGWDQEFAEGSPGVLNEIEFIENAAETFPHLSYIDSGAEEGSYMDKLWPDRYALVSGFYVTRTLARPVLAAVEYARRTKRALSYFNCHKDEG
jgi:CelD/BcsL family acetyltransferase involved in cellulose biosynthesis